MATGTAQQFQNNPQGGQMQSDLEFSQASNSNKSRHTPAVNYKPPRAQSLFAHHQRIKDIFKNQEYVQKDIQTDVFNFGTESFSIQQIYQHYYLKVSVLSILTYLQQNRYPIQGFMDVYFHDALQEFAKETNGEIEKLRLKTQKFAQLAQKLQNLNVIEQRLLARRAYEQGL